MPSFAKRVGSALKKRLGGDIPEEAKKAYEEEKQKALIKGAKAAGRKAGYAKGKSIGTSGGFGKKVFKDIIQGSQNVIEADPFGMGLGSFDVDKAGMINPFGKHKSKKKNGTARKRRLKGSGQNITIVVKQPGKAKKKPKRKSLDEVFMM
jgi:hypothetical protein